MQAEYSEFEDLRYKSVARQGPEKGYKPYKMSAKEKARLQELANKFLPRLAAEVTDTRETGAPVETKGKKSKTKTEPSLSPSEQLRAEGKVGFPMPTSAGGGWFSTSDWRKSFVEEVPDLWNKVDLLRAVANNRGVMATDKDLADALALGQTLLTQEAPDLARVGYDIARNPAASKQTKEAALAFSKAAEDRLFETGAPEITPEQVPNVENVIDEPGAAEVGSGMEELTIPETLRKKLTLPYAAVSVTDLEVIPASTWSRRRDYLEGKARLNAQEKQELQKTNKQNWHIS